MKKVTVKRKLVDRMIAIGRGLRYSEMIAELLKIQHGEDHKYDWRVDRGYFATNFSMGSRGYMVTGCGDCGVYKAEDGKWYAKNYAIEDMVAYKVNKIVSSLAFISARVGMDLQFELKRVDTFSESSMIRYNAHSKIHFRSVSRPRHSCNRSG